MRVIIAGRLSRKVTDRDQTGFDSQERESVRWAQANGHDVVAVVADFKSGRSGLEARKTLRPWVTEPDQLARYDGIVALKVDRLTRGDRAETTKLEDWAREHGKSLLIAGADVHFPSEGTDGIAWDLMLRMAHQEWLNTSERYRRMQRTLADAGHLVGNVPFGYRSVRNGGGHKTAELDPELVPSLLGMIKRSLDGKSLTEIADWLDSEGIPAVRGGQWSAKSVSQILRNEILHGRHKITLKTDGEPRTFTHNVEPVIDLATFRRLQDKLDNRPGRRGPTSGDVAFLTNIAQCGICGAPMYRHYSNNRRADGSVQRISYYRCNGQPPKQRSTCRNMVRADWLESEADEMISVIHGDRKVIERTVVPGNGHDDAIEQIDQDIRDLDPDAPDYDDQHAALRAERRLLQALPTEPDRIIERPTGMTVRELWATLDVAGKRDLLLRAGVKIKAVRGKAGSERPGGPDLLIDALTRL